MAVAHDTHTRFPTPDPATNLSNASTTTGDVSFTHTPIGTPAGVVVVVLNGDTAGAPCTGVTYAGMAMTSLGTFVDTSEAGSVSIWYLTGAIDIPTGPQTVVLQGCTADGKFATCSTVTSSTNRTALAGSAGRNHIIGAHTISIVTTADAMLYGGIHSGQAAISGVSPASGFTNQNINDWGVKVALTSRSSAIMAAGTITYGSTAGSDDNCLAVVALGEGSAGGVVRVPRHAVASASDYGVL